MHSLKDLREYLRQQLTVSPENLTVMAEQGTVINYLGRENDPRSNDHFMVEYTGIVFIFDYTRPPEILFHLVAKWCQSQHMSMTKDAIQFEAELLNHQAADIKITIAKLRDVYKPQPYKQGTQINYCPAVSVDPIIADNVEEVIAHGP